MNLIPHNFGASTFLKKLPAFELLEYKGEAAAGIQRYRGERGGGEMSLIVSHMIRQEEGLVWKACREMLERTLKQAALSMQGFFGFELLTLDLDEKMRSFHWGNFADLLLNHSRKMQVGETRLIPYASVFALFKKRMPEAFGKIDFYSPVKVFTDEPAKLDLFIKKMLKIQDGGSRPELLIYDLSQDPVFRFGDEEQTERLGKFLRKESAAGPLPEIFLLTHSGIIELGAQFGVRA